MEFVLERYNYWIIIVLMMGGLYIVFEAENMIKKLVGLGIFQTSVLFFYVTLGKTAGGTAPILVETGGHGDDHGDGHAAEAGHGAAAVAHGETHAAPVLHEESDVAHQLETVEAEISEGVTELAPNNVDGHASEAHGAQAHGAEPGADPGHVANGADAHGAVSDLPSPEFIATPHAPSQAVADAVYGQSGEPLHMVAGDIIYSNPLPHVLMLTAIVVGVATLSVGLALVVRIREAYGTIEMDEVRAADIAEGEAEGDAA